MGLDQQEFLVPMELREILPPELGLVGLVEVGVGVVLHLHQHLMLMSQMILKTMQLGGMQPQVQRE